MKIPSLLSLLAAFAFVSCDDSQTSQKLNEEKDAEILALQEKLGALGKDLEDEERDHMMLIAKYDVAIDSLKSTVKELGSKLQNVQKVEPAVVSKPVAAPEKSEAPEKEEVSNRADIEAARRAAVGEKHQKLELSTGRIYHDVAITGVDEIGVRFTHRNGVARIDFMNLPSLWQERFHFDVTRFLEARKSEILARYRWEKAVDERMAKIKEEQKIAAQKRIAALERALAEAKRPVQITQVTDARSRGISSLDRYSSSVIHPTWYSGRSSSSTYCPPVRTVIRRSSSPTYCPPVIPIRRSPVSLVPTIRSSPVVYPTPVIRAPVRAAPAVRPSYKLH